MKLGLQLNIKTRSEWTPNNLSSLTNWYKTNEGIDTFFAAGGGGAYIVTQWADQKGTNHLIDTATPANTSGYVQAHPKLDGGKVVFDHGGDQLDFTSHLSLGTFAIYMRVEFDSSFADTLFEDEAGNNFLKIQSSTEARFKMSGNRHDFDLPVTLSADTKYNIGWEREDTGSTTDDVMQVYVNAAAGSFKSGGTGDGTQAITDTLDLEKIGDPANTMKVYEIVICNNSLTAQDRSNLNTYFNKI